MQALLVAVFLLAPLSTPDFSGHWVLVDPREATGTTAVQIAVRQTARWTNVYGEPMKSPLITLSVERRGADGRVTTATYQPSVQGGGVTAVSTWQYSTRLDDEGFEFEMTNEWDEGSARRRSDHRERWTLSGDGLLAIHLVDVGPDGASDTRNLVYRKSP